MNHGNGSIWQETVLICRYHIRAGLSRKRSAFVHKRYTFRISVGLLVILSYPSQANVLTVS